MFPGGGSLGPGFLGSLGVVRRFRSLLLGLGFGSPVGAVPGRGLVVGFRGALRRPISESVLLKPGIGWADRHMAHVIGWEWMGIHTYKHSFLGKCLLSYISDPCINRFVRR